ncbi:Transposase, IS3 group [Moritella viscosa]|uniref:hypothetical protein n=1 Tax=Moritella viscosa TaxID=80854 RepID=UPI0009136754|nr:Transposase, IS3 group [Moritella viscosa]
MTKKIRRTFSAEFKLKTAQLVLDQDYTVLGAAEVMSGGNILTLQKILGHSTITQTMTYAHPSTLPS